ncbi:MAG: ABC transporter ATP-binding protein [Candidatus Izemoplasmatales bacterium]
MKRIFSFMKPYWLEILGVFALVTISALGTLLLPDYTGKMISEGITYNYVTQAQESDYTIILKYGLIMIGVTLLTSIASIYQMKLAAIIGSNTGKDIRTAIYKKVNSFSMAEAERFGTSTLITRSTNDVTQVQNFVMMALRMMLRVPIMLIGGIILSVKNIREMQAALNTSSQNIMFVLLAGIGMLILLIVITFILVVPLFKSLQQRVDRITQVAREGVNGVRVIRAFGQGKKEVKRFQKVNDELTDNIVKAGRIMSVLNPTVNLIFSLVVLGILYFAYDLIINNLTTDYEALGKVFAIIQYSTQILFSLLMLTMAFINFPRAQVSGNRISEILDQDIIVKDNGDPTHNDKVVQGKVTFNDVCFRYGDAELNVLDHITFEAKPGQTVAIIGSTGSGKSTIVNLIPRFHDVNCGSIQIDGVDIRDYTLSKLRSLVGFVPQTATLLTGTIRDNIAFGKKDATDEEIWQAAKIAQATEFIESQPDQLDAIVDQGGVNYSGGQKQRLSIARALVRKAPIYIFDDSFSALDFKTDAALRKALKQEVQEATVLIVAQRIGTIMDADQIIVLQEGKIVGIGKHKELLSNCEVYKEIALSQLSEEELA